MLYLTYEEAQQQGFTSNQDTFNLLVRTYSRWIDSICSNIFYPLTDTIYVDGLDLPFQPLNYSIINLNSVSVESSIGSFSSVPLNTLAIYKGDNPGINYTPMIAYKDQTTRFPSGFQNVRLTGTFGCCERSDNPDFDENLPESESNPRYIYSTPPLITKACLKLVLMNQYTESDPRSRMGKLQSFIKEEKTDYHEYVLSDKGLSSYTLTGDSELDQILEFYGLNRIKSRLV